MDVGENKDWSDMQESLMRHDAVSKVELAVHISDNERFVIWVPEHTQNTYSAYSFFHKKSHCKFIIVDSDTLKHGTSGGINIYSPDVLGILIGIQQDY